MDWKNGLKNGAKYILTVFSKEIWDFSVKASKELYEEQKKLVKIPDLKDVHIDEAIRILKDELHLIPTRVIANPSIAFADESDKEVMYSEPRFGSRVNLTTPIKVYYVTEEIIEKSKILLKSAKSNFKVPIIVGLNVYEAREDLENLGLRVKEKLETPNMSFINKEDGQVIKLTYPDGQKVGSKLKTGDRVILYYVNEEVIQDSKALKEKSDQDKKEMIENLKKITNDVTKNIEKRLVNPFSKNKKKSEDKE
jgi:beta-lactam-binding protein with PASTA domain